MTEKLPWNQNSPQLGATGAVRLVQDGDDERSRLRLQPVQDGFPALPLEPARRDVLSVVIVAIGKPHIFETFAARSGAAFIAVKYVARNACITFPPAEGSGDC